MKQIKDQYFSQGFTVVRDLATNTEIFNILDTAMELFENYNSLPSQYVYELGDLPGQTPAIRNLLQLYPELQNIDLLKNLTTVGQEILGQPVEVLFDAVIIKQPHDSFSVPYHQDEGIYELSSLKRPYKWIYVWLALTNTNQDNGCLWYIPGSHTGKILPHQWHNTNATTLAENISLSQSIPCPLKQGECSIHHPRVIHYSEANKTSTIRIGWLLSLGVPRTPAKLRSAKKWLLSRFKQSQYTFRLNK